MRDENGPLDAAEGARSFLKREAVLLAGLPAAAYLLTFSFERGVCEFYGITEEVISLSVQRIILFVSVFALVAYFAFVVMYMVVSFFVAGRPFRDWFDETRAHYGMATLVFVAFGVLLLVVGAGIVGGVSLGLGIISVGRTRLRDYVISGNPKLKEESEPAQTSSSGFWWRLSDDNLLALPQIARSCLAIFLLLVSLNFLVFEAGKAHASRTSKHAIIEHQGNDYIVARIFEGVCYCCPYYPDRREFGCQVVAAKLDSATWRLVRTGCLHRRDCKPEEVTSRAAHPLVPRKGEIAPR